MHVMGPSYGESAILGPVTHLGTILLFARLVIGFKIFTGICMNLWSPLV